MNTAYDTTKVTLNSAYITADEQVRLLLIKLSDSSPDAVARLKLIMTPHPQMQNAASLVRAGVSAVSDAYQTASPIVVNTASTVYKTATPVASAIYEKALAPAVSTLYQSAQPYVQPYVDKAVDVSSPYVNRAIEISKPIIDSEPAQQVIN